MKRGTRLFFIGLGSSFVLSLLFNAGKFNYDLLTGVGLFNLLIGGVMFLITVVYFLSGNKQMAKEFAIAAGILLLAGTLTCSAFPLKLRMM